MAYGESGQPEQDGNAQQWHPFSSETADNDGQTQWTQPNFDPKPARIDPTYVGNDSKRLATAAEQAIIDRFADVPRDDDVTHFSREEIAALNYRDYLSRLQAQALALAKITHDSKTKRS